MLRLLMLITLLSTTGYGSFIEFHQNEWSDGGPLVVSFIGSDNNLDGSLMADELTHFSAVWETPAGFSTAWGMSEIEPDGFIFTDVGNFLFFVRNTEYSLVDTAFEGEFLATVFDSQLFAVGSTTGPAQVVPEPSSFGILSAALVLLSLRLRCVRDHRTTTH